MKILFVSSGNRTHPDSLSLNQAKSLVRHGLEIDHFHVKGTGMIGYLKNVPVLRRHLKSRQYDIIHAHYGFCGLVSWLAKTKEKLVVSFMGSDILGINEPDIPVSFSIKMMPTLNIGVAKLFYDACIVKSDQMRAKFGRCSKVTVIPNGVDLELIFPEDRAQSRYKLGLPETAQLVVFVANPARKEKNFSLAQKSVDILMDDNINLLIVCDIEHALLRYYYSAADVLVLTSFYEGSPNVVKEAMACNCPIVATHVGDIEWVLGSTEGCYLTSFDPLDVSEKIWLSLVSGKKTKGRERIIEIGLDSETISQKIHMVYKTIIGKK